MTSFACYNDSIGDGDQMPPWRSLRGISPVSTNVRLFLVIGNLKRTPWTQPGVQ
nr:MAG TPA: hypothetical protein [Caudoviricetes sp.]